MSSTSRRLLLWSPRILSILVALFIGVFALDAVDEGISEFLLHAAPALVLLLIAGVSWRWEWVGGAVFITLALFYAVTMSRRMDWVLLISGPLFVAGALFLWSWRHHKELHAER